MSGKVFFDTNVLLYSLQHSAPEKQRAAQELLATVPERSGVISYQVLQEFVNGCLRRLRPPIRLERIQTLLVGMMSQFEVVPWSPQLIPEAMEIHHRYKFQWYDSLIVATALKVGCEVLYTEDMQHGQKIEGLTVVNPFLPV